MEIEEYIASTDQQLVKLALEGDSVAFEHLLDRYRNSIHQLYAQRMDGRTNEIGDLLQETFIKAFLNLDRYDERYTFGQWIYTIARNTFIDYVRRHRDDLSVDNYYTENLSPLCAASTPEQKLIDEQSHHRLEFFISQIPPRYRTLIEMRFFKEYSYEEIASKLNIPLGTVKTQIHRARTQLCQLLIGSGEFE